MKKETTEYLLLLDALRIPDAKFHLEKVNQTWGALYLGTIWQPQIENSPIWITVTPGDVIWQRWQTEPIWASSGIVFEYDNQHSHKDMIASLQKNITVKSEDGRLFLLRFYSPSTLSLIVKHGSPGFINGILGLADKVYPSPIVLPAHRIEPVYKTAEVSDGSALPFNNELIKALLS